MSNAGGRFHGISEFDGDRKSCRSKLKEHNLRRRRQTAGNECKTSIIADPMVPEAKAGIEDVGGAGSCADILGDEKVMAMKVRAGGTWHAIGQPRECVHNCMPFEHVAAYAHMHAPAPMNLHMHVCMHQY